MAKYIQLAFHLSRYSPLIWLYEKTQCWFCHIFAFAWGIPNPSSIPVEISSSRLNSALTTFEHFLPYLFFNTSPIRSNNDPFESIDGSKTISSSAIN